jgi:glycosyltransferase involved in cell wall biosynthesis
MTEPFGVGGVQSDMLALGPDLTARGHNVFLATQEGELLPELEKMGVTFVPADFHFSGLAGLWRAAKTLRKIIVENGIEVLAPQSVRTTLVALIALRMLPFSYRVKSTGKRIPIVTTIHNIHNPMHFRYGGWLLRAACDHVIFESHYERNRLLASGLQAEKSVVIHSGIDTERFLPKEPEQALLDEYGLDKSKHLIFGIVARLSEEKGHCFLLPAFAAVLQTAPNARLMVVGDGPLREDIHKQAVALGLGKSVIFTGVKRNIPEFLSIFDVFVLSSTRESFPLAAREAMAAGRAVVAPHIGGCPEVVDEGVTGILFEAGNVESLAEAMRKITDNKRYITMGLAARERVERLFSRKQWIEGDERVYESSLS